MPVKRRAGANSTAPAGTKRQRKTGATAPAIAARDRDGGATESDGDSGGEDTTATGAGTGNTQSPDSQKLDIASQLTALRAVAAVALLPAKTLTSPHRSGAATTAASSIYTSPLRRAQQTGAAGASPASSSSSSTGGGGGALASPLAPDSGSSPAGGTVTAPNASTLPANAIPPKHHKPVTPSRAAAIANRTSPAVTTHANSSAKKGRSAARSGGSARRGSAGRRTAKMALTGEADDSAAAGADAKAGARRAAAAIAAAAADSAASVVDDPYGDAEDDETETISADVYEDGDADAAASAEADADGDGETITDDADADADDNDGDDNDDAAADAHDTDGGYGDDGEADDGGGGGGGGNDTNNDEADDATPAPTRVRTARRARPVVDVLPAVLERKLEPRRPAKPKIKIDPATEPTNKRRSRAAVAAAAAAAAAAPPPPTTTVVDADGNVHSSPRKAGRPRGSINQRKRLAQQREAEERAAAEAAAARAAAGGGGGTDSDDQSNVAAAPAATNSQANRAALTTSTTAAAASTAGTTRRRRAPASAPTPDDGTNPSDDNMADVTTAASRQRTKRQRSAAARPMHVPEQPSTPPRPAVPPAPFFSLLSPERVDPNRKLSFLRRRLQKASLPAEKSAAAGAAAVAAAAAVAESEVNSDWAAYQSRLTHFLHSKKFRRWCGYDWFYSSLDRPFFEANEFVDCLSSLHDAARVVNDPTLKLRRRDWSALRAQMGKPRRLSRSFFVEERQKLHTHRVDTRALQWSLKMFAEQFPATAAAAAAAATVTAPHPAADVTPLIPDGQLVTARHPETKELLAGTVLGHVYLPHATPHDGPYPYPLQHTIGSALPSPVIFYRIQFSRPSAGAGAGVATPPLVPDTDVMPQPHRSPPVPFWNLLKGAEYAETQRRRRTQHATEDEPVLTSSSFPRDDADIMLISSILRLLDRKKALVDHLHLMNDTAAQWRTATAWATARAVNAPAAAATTPRTPAAATAAGASAMSDAATTTPTKSADPAGAASAGADSVRVKIEPTDAPQVPAGAAGPSAPSIAFHAASLIRSIDLSELVPGSFKQMYAWVIMQLDLTTTTLETALAQLRQKRTPPVPTAPPAPPQVPAAANSGAASTSGGVRHMDPSLENDTSAGANSIVAAIPAGAELSAVCRERARRLVDDTREVLIKEGEIPRVAAASGSTANAGTGTGTAVNTLIVSCISLVMHVQHCVDRGASPHELDAALEALRPHFAVNNRSFESISESISAIRSSLLNASGAVGSAKAEPNSS